MFVFILAFAIIIALFVVIFTVASYNATPEKRGEAGEKKVSKKLGQTIEGKQYVVNNFLFSVDGKSAQIDHIFINDNGVFVIETKNYSGRIYGKDSQTYWTQVLAYGKYKNKIYNPVMQNETHIKQLQKILPVSTPIHSLVVFTQNNTNYIESTNTIPLSWLKPCVNSDYAEKITTETMKEIYDAIIKYQDDTNVTEEEHIAKINETQEKIANNICPHCGATLVLRNGKYGDFYGCSNYPRCRFTKK